MFAEITSSVSPEERLAYARFVSESPAACYFQEPDWPDYAPKAGRTDYLHCTVRDDTGALRLYGLLRRTRLAGGLWIGAFRRGPVTATPDDLTETLPPLLTAIRKEGCLTLTMNPRWEDDEADRATARLDALGIGVASEDRQTLHDHTGLVDVRRTPDELSKSFSPNHRRQVKQAHKKGYLVTDDPGPDPGPTLSRFLGVLEDRRNFSLAGAPSGPGQIAHAQAKGGIVAGVWRNGERIGLFTGLRDANRILFMAGGWQDPDAAFPRSPLILDYLVSRTAGGALPGVDFVDVGGLSPEDAPDEETSRDRVKMRVSPRRVRLVQVHEIDLRPALAGAVRNARPLLRKLRR
ncbi:hypothetical protein [Pelagovum pacificum]|uniref:Uncharacterized protein n=1 Tax=Pelagovum pacificum TaxID=2588711 RepID=A0A5C5GF15_9RHOB|nr:hypothetical protein [Pelagovum pacificum]QQA43555.1 hypothetical protein I8N54_02965 [Pelagovum pacificum]TNY33308.1 hypothetical protein FHY64_08565 [Pelagovum pacificum]